MERETGIGPATNSLEGCDSTIELLPLKNEKTKPIRLYQACDLNRRHCTLQNVQRVIHVLLGNDIRRQKPQNGIVSAIQQ